MEILRNALFAALKRGSSSRLLWALLLAIMLLVAMFLLGWLNVGKQIESGLEVTGGRGGLLMHRAPNGQGQAALLEWQRIY